MTTPGDDVRRAKGPTMHTLTIYGSSDDLIEIEGDFAEEINWISDDDERAFLAVSDGTLLSALYDHDGVWRFNLIKPGVATMSKRDGIPDDEENYTDRVTLTAEKPFTFVLHGTKLAK